MGDDALQILRGILEYSKLPITITDLDGRLQLFSRAAEELTGYSSEEVLGHHASMLFPRKWRVPLVFAEVLEKGAAEDVRGMLRCKDGRVIPVSLYMTLVHDVLGRPAGYLAVTKDLSEQRRLEHELEQARIKEDFFTDLICHDVRNYDQTLLGYMDLLLEGALGALEGEADRLAQRTRRDAYELREFIERVRVLAGREPDGALPSLPVDLGRVLSGILGTLTKSDAEKPKVVVVEPFPDSCVVRADPLVDRLLRDLFEFLVDLGSRHSCSSCQVSMECDDEMVQMSAVLQECAPQLGAVEMPDTTLFALLTRSSEVFVLKGLAEQFGGTVKVDGLEGDGALVRLSLKPWSGDVGSPKGGAES